MALTRRVRWRVRGRVQGVGFRWFVVEAARPLGVSGWTRNLPTGEVELEAEGPPETLERFLAAVRRGPPLARVESVESAELAPRGEGGPFEVR